MDSNHRPPGYEPGSLTSDVPRGILVEVIGIEPIVTKVGGVTVRCHTITAALPQTMFP